MNLCIVWNLFLWIFNWFNAIIEFNLPLYSNQSDIVCKTWRIITFMLDKLFSFIIDSIFSQIVCSNQYLCISRRYTFFFLKFELIKKQRMDQYHTINGRLMMVQIYDKYLYPTTQWLAVRIHLSEIIEPPQWCLRYTCIEHWYGAIPSGAFAPPTMRVDDTSGGKTKSQRQILFVIEWYFSILFRKENKFQIVLLTYVIGDIKTVNRRQTATQNKQIKLHFHVVFNTHN